MGTELHVAIGSLLAIALAYAGTPLAIKAAARLEFYDKPIGYKGHGAPTPYLGGAVVVASFVLAAALVPWEPDRSLPLVAGIVVLWVVGTADDRRNLSPWLRLGVEVGLAAGLWALDLGWNLGAGPVVDLLVTCFWIAAVVNAFNLFDNMDGAAGTMAAVAAAGTAVLGVVIGDEWLTVAAAVLAGACIGFLPHNLSSPARIFLGDGGSMPVGFAIAALVMIGSADAATEWQALAMGLLFVGIPAVDTCLVMFSRRRRGIPLLTGGRDHLTHRTHQRLRTARSVALALGGAQALLAALALLTLGGGSGALVAAVAVYLVGAGVLIAMIDSGFEPGAVPAAAGQPESRIGRPVPSTGWMLVPLGLAAGLSSFASGGYESSLWVPAGLGLLALVVALAVSGRPRLSRPGIAALAGLAGLGGWSLLTSTWAQAPGAAIVNGNRYVVLAAFAAAALLLTRRREHAAWALAAVTTGVLALAAYELAQMLFTDGTRIFTVGRLDGPLGYINGQGLVFLMASFPLLAVAERRGRPWLAGLALGLVTVCGGLVVLSQSRGAVLASVAGIAVVMAFASGRAWRAAGLALVAIVLAGVSHPLLAVYRSGAQAAEVPADVLVTAATALLGAGALTAAAWWAINRLAAGIEGSRAERVRAAWLVALAMGAALALGAGVATGALGDRLSSLAADLRQPAVNAEAVATGSRLGGGSSNRYEYWRIAIEVFDEHPLEGVGGGGYAAPYFQRRTTTENVTQPHSLVFQTLAELGLVGGALLALFLAGLAWGLVATAGAARRSREERTVFVAAAGLVTAWLVQTSVDWIHLLPGVTAMALLAAAALLRRRDESAGEADAPAPGRRRLTYVVVPVVAVAIGVAAISLSRQELAEHYGRAARSALARDDLDRALREAQRSIRADPTAMPSYWLKAGALSRLGREDEAGVTLEQAWRREPGNFVTYVLLGDHFARAGDPARARRYYRRALTLNPRDLTLRKLAQSTG